MKVLAFANTLPRKVLASSSPSNHKLQTLKLFAQGVTAAGDHGELVTHHKVETCDVAMMLGWVHEHGKHAPHLGLRRAIIDQQRARGAHVVIADSNLFLYADQSNANCVLRYSFDGVFPDTGIYCDTDPDAARWHYLQRLMNITVKPWRHSGNHVLVCLQREGGWSMGAFSVVSWACQTVRNIRRYDCRRPIVIRGHPGDKNSSATCNLIQQELVRTGYAGNVTYSPAGRTLLEDLHNAHAMVNHNSSPAVAAAIEGVPIFVTDPARSQAQEVANADLSRIEEPQCFDRDAWLIRLSQFHWSHAELASGQCWQHMRRWIYTH